MKASKKRSLFLITVAYIIGLTATIISNLNPINAIYADNVSYGMTFSSAKNKFHNNSGLTPYSGEATAKTNLDNNINFEYKDLMGLNTTWHVVKAGGYFTNLDPINGLEKINISFKSDNDEYKIYWSYTTAFDETNVYSGTSSTSSPLNFNFNRSYPTYFRFENVGASNLNIGEINLKFACNDLIPNIVVSSSDESLGTVSGGNRYRYGETVTLTATPNIGAEFIGWYKDDELVSKDNPYIFFAEYDATFVAKFAVKTHEVKVEYDSNCGEISGIGSYIVGETVTLTAKAKDGYALDYWYDENLTELSREDMYSFVMPDYTVSLYVVFTTPCILTVISEDDTKGIANGGGQYRSGDEVTITLDEIRGVFKGWYNNNELVSRDNPYTFTMPSNDYSLIACFCNAKEVLGIEPIIDLENKTIWYGLYPQTKVNDASLISELNKLIVPESNGWYLYDGVYFAKTKADPWAKNYVYNDGEIIIDDNIYWFICKPIEWDILCDNDGEYYLLSKTLLDVYQYDHSANKSYINSDIRAWLNNEFYNSAFALHNEYILTTEVDNSASTTYSSNNPYACENTFDKIFLPSYKDYKNKEYGFISNSSRECKTTDWVRANGGWYSYDSRYLYNGWYSTRSPSHTRYSGAVSVNQGGSLSSTQPDSGVMVDDACVRPALIFKLS